MCRPSEALGLPVVPLLLALLAGQVAAGGTGAAGDAAGAVVAGTVDGTAEGDAEYGAWLAGECLACHGARGAGGAAIPAIAGRAPKDFVAAMQAYRTGARDHAVMAMVAGRLDDAQIAALVAYFAGLEQGHVGGD